MQALPDTALVKRASAIVTAVLPPEVLAHSHRAFLLGREVAKARSLAFDEEGFLVATLLHDLGLTDAHRDPRRAFPTIGGDRLRALMVTEPERAERLAQAIELHMRWFPRWGRSPEAGLLQVAAWMDVMGRAKRRVPAATRAQIERLHPRGDFAAVFRRQLFRSLGSCRACSVFLVP